MPAFFRLTLSAAALLSAVALIWPLTGHASDDTLPDVHSPAGEQTDAQGVLRQRIEQTRSRRSERNYDAHTVLLRETVWDMDGDRAVPHSDRQYSPAGVLLRERRWACGDLVSDLQYSVHGVLIESLALQGLGRTRERVGQTFSAQGILLSETRQARNAQGVWQPVGVQREWDARGQLLRQARYDERAQLLEERHFDRNGQLLPPASTH